MPTRTFAPFDAAVPGQPPGSRPRPDLVGHPLPQRKGGVSRSYALGQSRIEELEAHLAGCEPCRAYQNTYRRARTLTAETKRVAMPAVIKDRLRQFLLRALSKET